MDILTLCMNIIFLIVFYSCMGLDIIFKYMSRIAGEIFEGCPTDISSYCLYRRYKNWSRYLEIGVSCCIALAFCSNRQIPTPEIRQLIIVSYIVYIFVFVGVLIYRKRKIIIAYIRYYLNR